MRGRHRTNVNLNNARYTSCFNVNIESKLDFKINSTTFYFAVVPIKFTRRCQVTL